MQNHYEISSKYHFWTRNVRNLTKSRDLDMSGLAKTCPGGQILTANQRKYFYFSEITPFRFLLKMRNLSNKTDEFIKNNKFP